MRKFTSTPTKVTLFFIALLLQFSCTKDSDLLADYVLQDSEVAVAPTTPEDPQNPEDPASGQNENPPADPPTNDPNADFNGVNFSAYGAVGDGLTDDTAALQSALDSESSLIADAGKTFLISSKLDIDQAFEHIIEWNGSTIITNNTLNPIIKIDKRASNGGLTSMQNLTVNGNEVASRGVEVNSKVSLYNVDATGYRQPSSVSPAGFYINFYNDDDAYGDWVFDGCDVDNIVGASNGKTTDSLGAANGYLIYWRAVLSTSTTLIVKNAAVHDCWGEDAQTIAIFSSGLDISYSAGSMEFSNLDLYNWERRCVKAFTGNSTWTNCRFTDPNPSDSNLYSSNKSGMVVMGAGSGATGGDNILFESCTFTGRGYDGRVIPINTDNTSFKNCIFDSGSAIALTGSIGDVTICNNNFSSSSTIYGYGSVSYKGTIGIGTNNTAAKSDYIKLSASIWTSIICN